MIDAPTAEEQIEQWETGRSGKPLDFPAILFMKLASVLMHTRLGGKDRHRGLQDLEDTLTNLHDEAYRTDMEQAAKTRDALYRDGLADGDLTLIERKEAVDAHQRLWLAALMRMLKRGGLLGETWIKG